MLVIILMGLGCSQLWAAQQAVLKTIRMVGGAAGGQVEILANAPVTYAYYKADALQAVIDIAPATTSTSFKPDQLTADIFSSVSMETKDLIGVTATRLIFNLKEGASFSVQRSPEDKGRLLVTFSPASSPQAVKAKPESPADKDLDEDGPSKTETVTSNTPDTIPKESSQVATATPAAAPASPSTPAAPVESPSKLDLAPVAEVKEPVAAAPVASPPTFTGKVEPATTLQPVVPVLPAAVPAVTGLRVGSDSIVILTSGAVTKHNAFQLAKPRRLVIDISGAKNDISGRQQPVNRFGLVKARVGSYPDKVRVVFDLKKDTLPAYRIEDSAEGIVLRFKTRE